MNHALTATPLPAVTPMQLSVRQAALWTGAQLVQATPGACTELQAQRVHTDSRSTQPGDLFVALRGERFDGNAFIAQAAGLGAVAVLCDAQGAAAAQQAGMVALVVPDARQALGALAAAWRGQFELQLIAVTGSNGKTTVTQMLASILRAHVGHAAHATRGNLNNDIGVPLTLLALRAAHRMAVVELGMNHPGEIAQLAAWASPTVALVNNAQREHQEFMHTVQAVAQENGAVLAALPAHGVAVYPAQDTHAPVWAALTGQRRTLAFGHADSCAAVRVQSAHWQGAAWQVLAHTPQGDARLELRIAGMHNVHNAMAAVACALAAGVPLAAVVQGLQAFEPVTGRSRVSHLHGGLLTLVDDTYNANPDSVRAAIDVLAQLPAPRLLVLGDMGEVGDKGPEFHAEVGRYAAEKGIDALFTLGELSVHAQRAFGVSRSQHFQDILALQAAVAGVQHSVRSMVVKGSRFMQMERVIAALQAPLAQQQGSGHVA